jgi:hypothetical protein
MKNLSRRHIVIGGAVVVAVTAFAASADTLAGLGTAVGWHGKLSWSLPVAVDVLALVALVAWFTPGVTGLGKRVTVGGVVASIVLNAVGHLVGAGHLTPGPVLVVAVSAVPVISMALAAHLAVEVTRPVPEANTTAPERDTQVCPPPPPAPPPGTGKTAGHLWGTPGNPGCPPTPPTRHRGGPRRDRAGMAERLEHPSRGQGGYSRTEPSTAGVRPTRRDGPEAARRGPCRR